jgi:hypothetical protein
MYAIVPTSAALPPAIGGRPRGIGRVMPMHRVDGYPTRALAEVVDVVEVLGNARIWSPPV